MADSAADIEAHERAGPASSSMQTAKDLFSGAAGGIAQVLIGALPPPPSQPSLTSATKPNHLLTHTPSLQANPSISSR